MYLKMYDITDSAMACNMGEMLIDNLKVLISDISDPVFIVDMKSRQIVQVNDAASSGFGSYKPIGENVNDVVYIGKETSHASPAFFNNQWFEVKQQSFICDGNPFIKMVLRKHEAIPDHSTLLSLKNMIAVLLHRLRSSLTGMQGYLEIMQDDLDTDSDIRRFGILSDGIEQLFDMMDELELLHNVPLNNDNDPETYSADPEAIVHEILFRYPKETRKRVTFRRGDKPLSLKCNPVNLKKILSIMIKNAVEHVSGIDGNIIIQMPSHRNIEISHGGEPIPETITKHLFYPFVTSKANNLGIGLTMAHLLANQIRGSIFLTDNSIDSGISFTLCLSPVQSVNKN